MARYTCDRCGVECNTTNDPHLCADLKKRYERQAKAVKIVSDILRDNLNLTDEGGYDYPNEYYDVVSIAIIKALSNRDLGVE